MFYSKEPIGKFCFPKDLCGMFFLHRFVKKTNLPWNKITRYFRLKKDMKLVKASGIFDETWYLIKNTDVAQAKVDPCKHYLLYGGFEGRDPGPNFDSQWYLDLNPDVRMPRINPLLHYLNFGKDEGRLTKYSNVREHD